MGNLDTPPSPELELERVDREEGRTAVLRAGGTGREKGKKGLPKDTGLFLFLCRLGLGEAQAHLVLGRAHPCYLFP